MNPGVMTPGARDLRLDTGARSQVALGRVSRAAPPRTQPPRVRRSLVARWLAWRWSVLTSPLLLLALWILATAQAWAPEQILVPPLQVLAAAGELADSGELGEHVSVSLLRLVSGFAIGSLGGIAFGLLDGLSPRLNAYTAPSFQVLRQIPSVALIPLFILLFGIGETFKLVIVAKASFFIVALAVHEAVTSLPARYLEVAAMFRFTRLQVIRKLVLPAIVPATLTGVRIALGRSWMVLVGAELLAAENGLGQMMEMARQMFRLDVVMVGVILTGLIGVTLDRGFRLLEAWLMRWQRV
ncbi:ABC transporter permease [Massilia sp. 9I]|uniref:ABC transporter permease n=1 Tax=Massilia sp. 9I TaxID=2653152 RepID=UPI0012F202FE|nr:ABC transporter permease [Massilia sp. 9I]VXB82439.1 Alkanesulfonates transport system permease protein [Massilia sp. 9I]